MEEQKVVFVVEDDPVQQKMLQVHFEQLQGNYQVKTYADPKDMMLHLSEKPFAIVLDHFFADKQKTGLDYLAELRKSHRHLPVIYYTTLNDESVKKKVADLGAEEYIIKDSASLVRLRTALDALNAKSKKKGIFGRLFGK